MTAIVIPQTTTFGALTNNVVSRLNALNSQIPRLGQAAATASSGYEGTPGTQFEAVIIEPTLPSAMVTSPTYVNNFGVMPDAKNLGAQGQAYAYAVGQLLAEWKKFWTAAESYIEAIDNGTLPT
jgi:hypothetical protein